MVKTENGLFPVSSDGVLWLLPMNERTSQQVGQYLQIDIGGLKPTGSVGAPYGYKAVTDGAKIAGALRDVWRDAQLHTITVDGSVSKARQEFILWPKQEGFKVLWGHTPGSEVEGEAKVPEKLKRLARFVTENLPLDPYRNAPTIVLDLRPATDGNTSDAQVIPAPAIPDTPSPARRTQASFQD